MRPPRPIAFGRIGHDGTSWCGQGLWHASSRPSPARRRPADLCRSRRTGPLSPSGVGLLGPAVLSQARRLAPPQVFFFPYIHHRWEKPGKSAPAPHMRFDDLPTQSRMNVNARRETIARIAGHEIVPQKHGTNILLRRAVRPAKLPMDTTLRNSFRGRPNSSKAPKTVKNRPAPPLAPLVRR